MTINITNSVSPIIVPIIIYIGNKKWNVKNCNCIKYTSFGENNLQLGYNFCERLLKIKGISYLRLYVSAQNLFTLTKYSGLDPEIGSSNATLNGIDQGFYPQARTWTVGLNIKF